MNYVISAELREALLNYLVSRPYSEVAVGVQALQNLQPLDGEG
jgi:hypothetical protein